MTELDSDVARVLDAGAPASGQPDWEAVVAAARARDRRTSTRRAAIAAVAVLGAAVAVALWPSDSRPRGVLDRALAAVGEGPVVHLVLREGWGGTLIDLETGKRERVNGEREIWYDPKRGLREISRFGGSVEGDTFYPRGRVAPYLEKTFASLAQGYRRALESRRARVVERARVEGIDVYWIRVDAEMLPDAADDRLHEWAHDVGVSQQTYEPVFLRETRDGNVSPDGPSRVLEMKMLPDGSGDFDAPHIDDVNSNASRIRSAPIPLARAADALGRAPLWAGNALEGVPLQHVQRVEERTGKIQASHEPERAEGEAALVRAGELADQYALPYVRRRLNER